jgi:polysaccharide export outer membrane protein
MLVNTMSKLLPVILLAWIGGALAAPTGTLGAGDLLRVTVYGHPDLESVERVAEDGAISFPLVGEVQVAGMTEREVESALARELRQRQVIRNPEVNVTVEEYRGNSVSILGNVANPGVYGISRDGTLVDAIAEAGGLTEEAGRLAIVTKAGNGSDSKTTVDLADLLERGNISLDVVLGDGDRVFIPPAPRFYIYGQVNRPDSYRLEKGMTVMQAISVAGGLTGVGTERGLTIKRSGPNPEEPATIPADITTSVKEGDVIFVRESLF